MELPHHEIISMSMRSVLVTKSDEETPTISCPLCGFNGKGWEKFPKPSTCGKVSAGFLAIVCMCCLPFCCNCSIEWDWMCPSCHRLHKPGPGDIQP